MSRGRALAAAIAALLVMFSIGSLYAWSVFLEPLETQLGVSRASVSVVFSVAVVCFTLSMLIGPRLHRRMAPGALALLALGLAAAGLAVAGWGGSIAAVILGYGGLFGIANGLGYGLGLQVVQSAMPERRGLLTGLAVACYTLGSAVFAPLFAWGNAAIGVTATFLATAGYMVAAGLAAYVLLTLSGARFPHPTKSDGADVAIHPRTFWILWLGFLFGASAGVMVLGHAATIVGSLGGSVEAMAFGTSLVAVGNGLGRFLGGWLSDRLPARRLLSVVLFAGGAALLAVVGFPDTTVALLALLTLGLGYGAMAGGYPVVISHLYGIAMVGRVYGRVFTAWGIAGVMSPLLAGVLFDRAGDYRLAIVLGACAALCAGLTCLAIPAANRAPDGARYPAR